MGSHSLIIDWTDTDISMGRQPVYEWVDYLHIGIYQGLGRESCQVSKHNFFTYEMKWCCLVNYNDKHKDCNFHT